MIPATARPLEALLERLRAALIAVENAGSLTHRRAAAAHMHLEFEIAPLLETIDLEAITTAIQESAVAEYKRKQALPPRTALPMSTDQNMLPGHRFTVTSRPQMATFRPDRLFIASPELWAILDIRIGNRSQTAQYGAMPGVAFGDPDLSLRFEVAQTAMDVVIEAEYIGDRPEGEVFRAAFMGIAAGHDVSTWGPPVGARRMGDPHRAIGPSPIGQPIGVESIHPNDDEGEIIGTVIANAGGVGQIATGMPNPACVACGAVNNAGAGWCGSCGEALGRGIE